MSAEQAPPVDRTAMIEDYVATREDERSFQATQVALASLALTTLGALAGLIGRFVLPSSVQSNPIPPGLLVLTPAVPLALFGMFAQAGAQATLRTHYLRDLEIQLTDGEKGGATPSPSFIRLSGALVGLRHGHAIYRAITAMLISIALSAFIIILILIGTHVPGPWAAALTVSYATAILMLVYLMVTATASGEEFYLSAHRRLAQSQAAKKRRALGAPKARRRMDPLLAYLSLPRPADFIKSLYYVAGFLLAGPLGLTPDRSFAQNLAAAIWGWVVLELLAYQARYQWNDIRGQARDKLHPAASRRRRLPDTPGSERASAMVAAWRIAAALILALGAPYGTRPALLVGVALIFVLAALYETARLGERPIPVFFLVAAGYPLRFCLGLAVAGYGWTHGWLGALVGVVAFAAIGWSTVGLTWILEADEMRRSGHDPGGHRDWLWRAAKLPVTKPDPYEAPLKVGYPLFALPNIAQLIACAAVVWLAHLATPAGWSIAFGLLLLVSTGMMLWLMHFGIRDWRIGVLVLLAIALVTGLSFWSAPHLTALWAPILWTAFAVFYLTFRSSTYNDLMSAAQNAIGLTVVVAGGMRNWLGSGRWKKQTS